MTAWKLCDPFTAIHVLGPFILSVIGGSAWLGIFGALIGEVIEAFVVVMTGNFVFFKEANNDFENIAEIFYTDIIFSLLAAIPLYWAYKFATNHPRQAYPIKSFYTNLGLWVWWLLYIALWNVPYVWYDLKTESGFQWGVYVFVGAFPVLTVIFAYISHQIWPWIWAGYSNTRQIATWALFIFIVILFPALAPFDWFYSGMAQAMLIAGILIVILLGAGLIKWAATGEPPLSVRYSYTPQLDPRYVAYTEGKVSKME